MEKNENLRQQYSVNLDPRGLLAETECFALDLDGTLYLGGRWIDGALDFLAAIRESGRKYCFLTNNSSRGAAEYRKKLAAMGLDIDIERELVSSGAATADYIKRAYPGKRVWLLGNRALRAEFAALGLPHEEENPDIVVTAFDTELDYQKLRRVCDLVRAGLPFIATHPDFNCPTETGFMPDIGATHAYIEASAGRRPDFVVGKPWREIMEYLARVTGCPLSRTAMVGDRLYTDVAAGCNSGALGILVLSGEAGLTDIASSDVSPNLVFDSVKEMIPFLKENKKE